MGTTTWHPRTSFESPRKWLLTNGEVVEEPPLEQSPSGRKVRVTGTNLTAFSRDMDELILRAIKEFASQKQTDVWMSLDRQEQVMARTAGFDPTVTPAQLHVLQNARTLTVAWWKFRHATLPIEALLYVRAERGRYGNSTSHQMQVGLVQPDTLAEGNVEHVMFTEHSWNFSSQCNRAQYPADVTLRQFVRDTPPTTWEPHLVLAAPHTLTNDRMVVESLLDTVRRCEELETIQIPDLRDTDAPDWLNLDLYETNVNANFLSDLTEYLEGTPSVERALQIYDDLRACLRSIGVVMEEKTETDFHKGLLGDEPTGVTVNLGHPLDDEVAEDRHHTLRMHLPTGTFIVDCDARINHTHVAERWDEALTVASLTGEEDTLLAFAREVAKRDRTARAKRIIKARKGDK